MYIDIKEGLYKAKDGAILWKTFGVFAGIFLILFFCFSGTAKVIFGILCALNLVFIIVLFCAGFIMKGSKKEHEESRRNAEEAMKRYQELMNDSNNHDFVTEFSSWYLLWSNGKYDAKSTGNTLMKMSYMLQTCDCNGIGAFEKCLNLFHSGVTIEQSDKIAIVDGAVRLCDLVKDNDRVLVKSKISAILSKY